jgi:hypothetical protein
LATFLPRDTAMPALIDGTLVAVPLREKRLKQRRSRWYDLLRGAPQRRDCIKNFSEMEAHSFAFAKASA